jgi:GntR family transcriptional regulator/MocR family aminotransferase
MDRVDHFGRDLFVVLDREDGRPLRVQLEEQLRDGVRSGRLRAGTALPSTRALAQELGVARGVVVEAYGQLVAEGFLVARRGSATRVAKVAPAAGPAPAATAARLAPVRFDLRPESADRGAFPRRAWLAATRRALADAPDADLGYGAWAGAPALRAVLAAYLGRARGVVADPDHIVVTAGITQAIALLAGLLHARGARRVVVEEPGFWQHRTILQRAGLALAPVEVDERGMRTDGLPQAAAALVTPAHQMPTGAVLAPERRAALLDWATAHDALVIEDDYDGEYRYDREPVGALQGLGGGRVIYLGSTSKTLAPALRLGWMVLPGALAGAIADERGWSDGGSPALDQLALATFIERGELDRHLRRMRLRYRRRRDRLVAALGDHLPDAEVGGVAAGLHITVALAPDADVDGVIARALERGVAVFATQHAGRALLLVGYANIDETAIEPAVRALAAAVRG